jgi:flagellar basal body-associated protein FliL
MKNSKSKKTTIILVVILLGLLAFAYKMLFMPAGDDSTATENIAATARVESLLQLVESIKFDTAVMQDPKFKSLKSFETPLLSLPVGRTNPFAEVPGHN